MGLFDRLTRKRQDTAPKRATRRGRGPGRTQQTRVDDLEQVRDKRRPQGVTSPIKDAAKATKPPTTAPRPPKARDPLRLSPNIKMVPDAEKPPRPLRGTVTGKDKTSGKLRRNVGEGRDKRANVTREQLKETGMTLRQYLNFMDKEGKRPPKKSGVDKVPNKKDPRKKYAGGGMMKSKMKAKGMKAGGKMKSKGYSAGGKMKAKGMAGGGKMKAKGMKAGGKMKSKGYSAGGKMKAKGMKAGGKMKAKGMAGGGKMKAKGMAVGGPLKKAPEGNTGLKKLPKQVRNKMGFMAGGGMMKTKGMKAGGKMKAKGGATGGKKQKVRGAGIARKGVRPAKMR